MKETEPLSAKLGRWLDYCWLYLTDFNFQRARDKRQAYYDYRLGKIYSMRFF